MPWAHRLPAELRRRRRWCLALAGGLAIWMGPGGRELGRLGSLSPIRLAWAAPQDEISRRDFGIAGFKPPPRWEVLPSERRSYAQLLAWASRGEGPERAVITLVGKRLPKGATLKTMIDEALGLRADPRAQNVRAQLQLSPGWIPNQRVQVDALLAATKTRRAQVMRQLIYLNAPFAYVLTLVCPQEQALARYRDLDDTAGNLTPIPIPGAEVSTGAPAAGGAAPAAPAGASATPPAPARAPGTPAAPAGAAGTPAAPASASMPATAPTGAAGTPAAPASASRPATAPAGAPGTPAAPASASRPATAPAGASGAPAAAGSR